MDVKPIYSEFLKSVKSYPDKDALGIKVEGKYSYITYSELNERVRNFGAYLLSIGLSPKDRVAIFAENGIDWAVADLGSLAIGCVDVPIFHTLSTEIAEHIIKDSGATVIFVSGRKQFKQVLEIKENTRQLKSIIVSKNESEGYKDKSIKTIDEVYAEGKKWLSNKKNEEKFEKYVNEVKNEDLASIIYTSGTTGLPKGVMLTHYNFVFNGYASTHIVDFFPEDRMLSFLPLSHVFERTPGFYLPLFMGSTISFAQSTFTLVENMRETKPTIMMCVPRLFETMYDKILYKINTQSSDMQKKIFKKAIKVGTEVLKYKEAGKSVPTTLKLAFSTYDFLVFRKLRRLVGGSLRFFISGAAALQPEIAKFFKMVGLVILEGYGLTEASPVVCVNPPSKNKIGTIGIAIKDVEVKTAEDGELLVKGDNVMQGYWKKPKDTKTAIDKDGWLYTGDIGSIDEEGYIKITDRKKNIIVLSSGKNVAPQPIEEKIKRSQYIQELILIGDEKKFIAALIIPEYDRVKEYIKKLGIIPASEKELVSLDEVNKLIKKEIDTLSDGLSNYELIRNFTLLDVPFSQDNGTLTPTLKKKRKIIQDRYKEIIDSMYNS